MSKIVFCVFLVIFVDLIVAKCTGHPSFSYNVATTTKKPEIYKDSFMDLAKLLNNTKHKPKDEMVKFSIVELLNSTTPSFKNRKAPSNTSKQNVIRHHHRKWKSGSRMKLTVLDRDVQGDSPYNIPEIKRMKRNHNNNAPPYSYPYPYPPYNIPQNVYPQYTYPYPQYTYTYPQYSPPSPQYSYPSPQYSYPYHNYQVAPLPAPPQAPQQYFTYEKTEIPKVENYMSKYQQFVEYLPKTIEPQKWETKTQEAPDAEWVARIAFPDAETLVVTDKNFTQAKTNIKVIINKLGVDGKILRTIVKDSKGNTNVYTAAPSAEVPVTFNPLIQHNITQSRWTAEVAVGDHTPVKLSGVLKEERPTHGGGGTKPGVSTSAPTTTTTTDDSEYDSDEDTDITEEDPKVTTSATDDDEDYSEEGSGGTTVQTTTKRTWGWGG